MHNERTWILLILLAAETATAWRVAQSATSKPVCDRLADPEWPLAYAKYSAQVFEAKGRVNSNLQDLRHTCARQGVQSKCSICEDIKCGPALAQTCSMQLQGVLPADLATNKATVSDTPWAVQGSHRNDFNGSSTTHVCVMISGGSCTAPDVTVTDYSACAVRCWGHSAGPPVLQTTLDSVHYVAGADNDALADAAVWDYKVSDAWAYKAAQQAVWGPAAVAAALPAVPPFNPQGYLFTLAGSGSAGYADGVGAAARFSSPHDVAADASGNVYVADTGNHCIRKVTPAGLVTTVAGTGAAGHADGAAAAATFSRPTGVAVSYENGAALPPVLYVADRGNHRIRRIDTATATVTCYAGR
jgi:NHL repeat